MSKILIPNQGIHTDERFESLQGIADKAADFYKDINRYQTKLQMLAIANPKDIVGEDEDPVESLSARVKDCVDSIIELTEDGHRLNLIHDLIDDWRFDENPIDPRTPEGFKRIFVDSDDFKSCKFDEKNPFELKDFERASDYFAACIKDVESNSQDAGECYVIYFNGHLLKQLDNKTIYKSVEEAERAFKLMYMPSMMEMITPKYRAKNPLLFTELAALAERHPEFGVDHTLFENVPEKVDMKYIDKFCKSFDRLVIEYFKLEGKLKIVKL